jgi:uncharacterized protein (DUF1800 family)
MNPNTIPFFKNAIVRPALRGGLLALALSSFSQAVPVTLWQIGEDEDPYSRDYNPRNELGGSNYNLDAAPGRVTRMPGDPLYNAAANPSADGHFYQAGTYPAGFNSLTSPLVVPNAEPATSFESFLRESDPSNSIHFILTAAQASSQSRLRLSFEFIEGGSYTAPNNGDDFGKHNIEVRFKTSTSNTLVFQRVGVDRSSRFNIDIPAAVVNAVTGANTVEIRRTGPAPAAGTNVWVGFDFVKMEIDTDGMADGDSDGLPRWWERDNQLSDSNASDAAIDKDGDSLTALQEYNLGVKSTDPNRADTDGDRVNDAAERTANADPNLADTDSDGLSDGDELFTAPTSSPTLADTDSDTFPDAWEKRVGSNPNVNSSKPVAFPGAIGLNFVSSNSPGGTVPWLMPAGVVPQIYWNNTVPLRTYNRETGNTSVIASPNAAVMSRSNGVAVSGMTFAWTSDGVSSVANDGSGDQKLMNGMIRARDNGQAPAALSFTGIPFTNYHVIVYVGSTYDGYRASVDLNDEGPTIREFTTASSATRNRWQEILPTAKTPAPVGNYVRYTNRTSPTLTVNLTNIDGYNIGINAVQFIDANLDADSSGIPDWYEIQHGLQPATAATASADADTDGLTNLQEYQRSSNPKNADTDGDGLSDNIESAANSLTIDSDEDGVSDYAEVNSPLPSNPSSDNSDGDTLTDKEETELGTDPSVATHSLMPVYTATPKTWEWKLEPIQLVWDHRPGAGGRNYEGDETLVSFYVRPVGIPSYEQSMRMQLQYRAGRVSYNFRSSTSQAFSSTNANDDIYWYDYNDPQADLTSALGFSGFGAADLSDKLRFRMFATRGATNSWNLNFRIENITRGTTVITRSVATSTAAANLDDGTVIWSNNKKEQAEAANVPSLDLSQSCRLFMTNTSLETLPAFAAFVDTDDDGMPNQWEDTYLFNKNSNADALLDADTDGLKNREEYLAGTNPKLADTDGDGINDKLETTEGSSPLIAGIKPPFASGNTTAGADFNGNGLPDAWEARYKFSGISASADSDGDGASNAKEAAWGTDPFDGNSKIAISLQRSGNDAVLSWTKISQKNQRISRSSNLTSWQNLALAVTPGSPNDSARVNGQFTAATSAFFNVDTLDKDTDTDGVSDWDEVFLLGSNPAVQNSVRNGSVALNSSNVVTGNVSGDYAAFSSHFKNSLPGTPSSQISREQAARFLQQASFGPTMQEIERVQMMGINSWIENQISTQPITSHRPYIEEITRDVRGPRLDTSYLKSGESRVGGPNAQSAFAQGAIKGPDQLRQRVAFALSQILVTSRRDANLSDFAFAMTDYQDIFVRNAFGNYRDILGKVSFHPVMGRYLSHLGNQKARPEINQYPDENYAREVMQLFTIGLWELNQNGMRKLNSSGQFIPTYTNGDITEMARVFTGFWLGGQEWGNGNNIDEHFIVPMMLWADKHDFEEKQMLQSLTIPKRAATEDSAIRDVNDALDFLFNHPNTPPFICRQLIQYLVTTNPSPAYVERVANIFVNNGSGKRGDLAAVIRAILLDQEARNVSWSHGSPSFGRLKDPVQRSMSIARVGNLARFPKVSWWDYNEFYDSSLQAPSYAPSVFNFYRPDYRSQGVLTQNQLSSAAFQIVNSYSAISYTRRIWEDTLYGLRLYDRYAYPPDYRELLEVASDPAALADRSNLLFCGGMMSAATRSAMMTALTATPASETLQRVQLAVYIASTCPEGAIQR